MNTSLHSDRRPATGEMLPLSPTENVAATNPQPAPTEAEPLGTSDRFILMGILMILAAGLGYLVTHSWVGIILFATGGALGAISAPEGSDRKEREMDDAIEDALDRNRKNNERRAASNTHFGPDVDAAAAKAVREGRLSQRQVDIIRSTKITNEELTAMGKAGGFYLGKPYEK